MAKRCDCRSLQLCGTRGGFHHTDRPDPRCDSAATVRVRIGDLERDFCDGCRRADDAVVERYAVA